MSVNASQHELIQLIYRHLKEHGFHSAANELQRHGPQGEANTSTSLLDIYTSWLNDSKRKPDTAKRGRTPSKASKIHAPAAINQTQAGDGSSSDGDELSQSLLPQTPSASSKKSAPMTPVKPPAIASADKLASPFTCATAAADASSDTTDISQEVSPKNKSAPAAALTAPPAAKPKKKKDKTVIKAETQKKPASLKSKKSAENATTADVAAAGGDGSDSDSSLDVEKWKKLLLHMTEADIAKMDTLNALDSSTPQPKKKIVRKPRTKPPAKVDAQVPQSTGTVDKKETVQENNVTETPAKKSGAKKPASVTSSLAMKQSIGIVEVRPSISAPSPSKQTTTKDTMNAVTAGEEKTDETSEPKKKKKKKEMEEDAVDKTSNETGQVGKDKGNKGKKKNEVAEKTFGDKPLEKEKAKETQGNGSESEEALVKSVDKEIVDSTEQEKNKEKKAKKKKEKNDREDKLNTEKTAEEENTEKTVQTKKAKKKKKERSDVESSEKTTTEEETQRAAKGEDDDDGNKGSELTACEKKRKKKRKRSDDEGNSECVFEDKKRRKKHDDGEEISEQNAEASATNKSESSEREGDQEINTPVKGKNKKNSLKSDSVSLSSPLPDPETLGPPSEKKKKKNKSKSTDVPPVISVQDTAAMQTLQNPLNNTKKKKKKSSKNTSLQDV